jgi:predicted dehydrogenase
MRTTTTTATIGSGAWGIFAVTANAVHCGCSARAPCAPRFTVSTQMFPCQRVYAYGSGGSLSVEVPFNMYADVPGKVTVNTGIGERVIETEIADQYLLEFDTLAQALIEKTEVPNPVSDALANMAVLDSIFKAAASGKWEPVQAPKY